MIQYLLFLYKSDKVLAKLNSEVSLSINEKLLIAGLGNYKIIDLQHQCMTRKDFDKTPEAQATVIKIAIVVKCKSIHNF